MAAAEWPVHGSPSTTQAVDIGAADTACLNLDINIKGSKWLWCELELQIRFERQMDACSTYFSLDELGRPQVCCVQSD